ncbi:flavodoxin family protein [Desulfopila aestuarii]|uniref:Multimeric flavodoxin WrbA n=1 Tax=Desulfopila aestuarii DSM 18488 TaxID=1121416 RepID=A0A1M7XVJ4_9BACT|nr:flavodoxin family protein [Desulfopila aestuarii]SHO42621.1 Multimeric flavodoxin WrbA [Desulfopila aestuarii DSM 18488]
MHMVIVLGSPRISGNSETLARAVAEGVENHGGTVEYFRLNKLSIRPCQGCGGCEKSGACVIKDDMTPIYDQIDKADRLLVVTPIYFYAPSAQTKIFIDRIQARWARRYSLKERFRQGEGRRGYLLATAATRGQKLFESSELIVRYTLDALDMECGESLLVSGVDERGAVKEQQTLIDEAKAFGEKIGTGVL